MLVFMMRRLVNVLVVPSDVVSSACGCVRRVYFREYEDEYASEDAS